MNIHDLVAEKVATAQAFAADGAFYTAARLHREAADALAAHMDRIDRQMFGLRTDPGFQLGKAQEGRDHLVRARNCFAASDNQQTLARVRSALSSARGAVRINEGRRARQQNQEGR